jgi:hypothetical protein
MATLRMHQASDEAGTATPQEVQKQTCAQHQQQHHWPGMFCAGREGEGQVLCATTHLR